MGRCRLEQPQQWARAGILRFYHAPGGASAAGAEMEGRTEGGTKLPSVRPGLYPLWPPAAAGPLAGLFPEALVPSL